jgi:hypothetical protein
VKSAGLAILVLGALSCTPRGGQFQGFFSDVTASSGIDFQLVNGASGEHYLVETMLGGLGWIDYDGDGHYDLYVVNGHADPLHAGEPGKETDRLFRNNGSGRFTDVTAAAGLGDRRYGSGLAVGDYDNDGDADLLVTNFGENTLYRNDGNGTFSDVTRPLGLAERGYNMSAVWFDMDRDGDLDLYVTRYLRYDPRTSRRCREQGVDVYCHPKFFPGEPDLLYQNREGTRFEEIGKRAGIARAGVDEGKGLGVVAADFDRDGYTDVYVANDMTPNFLWHNNGDSTFTDIAQAVGVALSSEGRAQAGMGVDVGDVNGDGLTDIYVTNFARELNALYLATGQLEKGSATWPRGTAGGFVEASRRANLQATFLPLGFGTLFADVDLDGDQDIVTVNGQINDRVETTDPGSGSTYRQLPALFLNDGAGVFEDGRGQGGAFFSQPMVGRGLARCDFDGDGDIDLAVMTIDRSVILLANENPLHHRSLVVHLVGKTSPRDGYGARIEAEVGGKLQVFEYQSARSYLSASDPRVIVGLGQASQVDRLTVYWPSGKVGELFRLQPGRVTVEEN